MTKVKICGLRRPEDAIALNPLRPDMAGFVFYGPSRRNVPKETAMSIREALDPSITSVGVFVDENPLVVADLVDSGVIGAVQLHGVEDNAYIRGLRRLVDVPIIKTFIVRNKNDVERSYGSDADIVLFDSGKGSGKCINWTLLRDYRDDFILSGGLNPENVGHALEELCPYAVDVSSGVETAGWKDPAKMREFVLEADHRFIRPPTIRVARLPIPPSPRTPRPAPYRSRRASAPSLAGYPHTEPSYRALRLHILQGGCRHGRRRGNGSPDLLQHPIVPLPLEKHQLP